MTTPKGYENLNDPPKNHCWDGLPHDPGRLSQEYNILHNGDPKTPTCCWCGQLQRVLIRVPEDGHGPFGQTRPTIRDFTEGVCPR